MALKLLLLAFMATVFVLASKATWAPKPFLHMNRCFWFRKARNATAFFFHISGSGSHDKSGWGSCLAGSENRPLLRIHSCHCLLEIKSPSLREAAGNARACSRFRSRGHKKVAPSPTLRTLVKLTGGGLLLFECCLMVLGARGASHAVRV